MPRRSHPAPSEEQLPLIEVRPATLGEVLYFGREFDRLLRGVGRGRRGRGREVAGLVTPPLCPMCGTFRSKSDQSGSGEC